MHVSPISDDKEFQKLQEFTLAYRVTEIVISGLNNHYNCSTNFLPKMHEPLDVACIAYYEF